MSFPYKKVLVVGATSGIGLELAERLISQGVNVIAVGRRQDRLDAFVSKAGSHKASAAAFDLANLDGVPSFAQSITKSHPDLDCVFLNAGVQYVMDFSKPHTVDIGKIQYEMTVNYISFVALTHAFMPFFQRKAAGGEDTSSSLESIPYPMVLNYCASKAALRSFILSVREQLNQLDSSKKVKIVELVTPLVQTELHSKQPGWEDDSNPGMPVKDFISVAMEGFASKSETVAVGMAKGVFDQFEEAKGPRVTMLWAATKKALGSAHVLE